MAGRHSIGTALESLLTEIGTKGLSERAEKISRHYRDAAPSSRAISSEADALAYALVRAPATQAAIETALNALVRRAPEFTAINALDAGAGPGTASWALAGLWPEADITLVDTNATFRALAKRLMAASDIPALRNANVTAGDLAGSMEGKGSYDLVVAAYALTELPDTALDAAVDHLWAACSGALLIVEPGRPREYRRLMRIRDNLLAQGGAIAAPCPHAQNCPLEGDDWCHFPARVQRTRLHRQLKRANMGYEDEKYSYLAVVRPDVPLQQPEARIVAPKSPLKYGIRIPICDTEGARTERTVVKRDADYKRLRKRDWGETI